MIFDVKDKKILITGAAGQIGSELTELLRNQYGNENVVAAIYSKSMRAASIAEPFCKLDIRDQNSLEEVVKQYQADTIFHLASLLSAKAEENPQLAWEININGLINVLEVARENNCAVFFPSSIGAFGPTTPRDNTPQITIQRPNSIYGISKLSGELLCDYYYKRYAVDTRGLRYPGIISYQALPGGGTTDYAVHMFYAALQDQRYDCYLKPDTKLDMMYMPDALHAAVNLMQADSKKLLHRNAYNVTAMSFTPQELAQAIQTHIPEFEINYKIDSIRQTIADSWPNYMDDSAARQEWGWRPSYTLSTMVKDMLLQLAKKLDQ